MKISIITPTYNQAEFIEKTIKSVLEQKDVDLEYWVIDGGSTDNTIEILTKYKTIYKNFNFITELDNGQAHAINKGLKLSKGEIIGWINSDDVYVEDALKKVISFFDTNRDIGWAYGKYKIINKEGREIRKFFSKYKNWIGRKYSYSKLLSFNIISQPSMFWTRSALGECGYLDEDQYYIMDYEYWCRLGKKFQAKHIPEFISLYRFYDEAKSGSGYISQYWSEFLMAMKYDNSLLRLPTVIHFFHFVNMIIIFKLLYFLNINRK